MDLYTGHATLPTAKNKQIKKKKQFFFTQIAKHIIIDIHFLLGVF